jgi:hypothetical protein
VKICKKCGYEKALNQFHIDKTKKFGVKNICKKCRQKPNYKIRLSNSRKTFDRCIMVSMNRALKRNKNNYIWERVVGYKLKDLKEHLEKQFTIEMNWNNFGTYWWIDKIIPRSSFIYNNTKNNEFHKCWSLKNLRPLDRISCIKKKNRIMWNLIKEYQLFDILPLGLILVDKYD